MFYIKRLFIFFQFLFYSIGVINFSFGQISEFTSELSSKKINTTIQDSYGLTWIATEEGLNMFDGKIVHNFESILADNTTLINNSIFNIIEHSNLIENKILNSSVVRFNSAKRSSF